MEGEEDGREDVEANVEEVDDERKPLALVTSHQESIEVKEDNN